MAKNINQVAIAEQVGVDKGFVNFILEGKRNPNTEKGMEVLISAANQYAEKCKAEYIAKALRKWRLNETIKKRKKKIILKENKSKQKDEELKEPKIKPIKLRPFQGTSWHKVNKAWRAQIRIENKNRTIGYFETREKAAEAYRIAKEQVK